MSVLFLCESTALLLWALLLRRRCAEPSRRAAIGFAAIAALPLLALVQLADLGWHPLSQSLSIDMTAPAPMQEAASPWSVLWIGYGIVAAWQLLRWGGAQWRLRRWLREARPCRAEQWQRQSRLIAGAHAFPVRVHASAGSPFLLGLLRPCVVIPGYLEHCSEARAKLVLLHEFAHWRARDPQRLFLVDLIYCLLWFQPLLQRVRRGFCADIELACDDRVLRAGSDAHDYAETIALCASKQRLQTSALVGMAMQRSQLVQRVTRILAQPETSMHAGQRWFLPAVCVAGLLLLCVNFSPRVEIIATASARAQAAVEDVQPALDAPMPAVPPATWPELVAPAPSRPAPPARPSAARAAANTRPSRHTVAPTPAVATTSAPLLDSARLRQSISTVVDLDAQRYAQQHAGEALLDSATTQERFERGFEQSRAERKSRNERIMRRVMSSLLGTIPLN